MGKYLKKFETTAQYESAKPNLILPNVSLIVETNGVAYNPYVLETKLIVYYDIQDISSPTTVCTNYDGSFKSMEIDGVYSVDISTMGDKTYQFDSVGEHVIKYELNGLGTGAPLFNNLSTVKRVVIPNVFTSIGNSAFYGCTNLTSCTIGNSVTSIGDNAFYNCNRLTSIDIPSSVTSIGTRAFWGCSSITSCTIGSGVTNIGEGAFTQCSGLTSIDIPSSVTSIGTFAFSVCISLTSCTIGSGVTSIGQAAFGGCSGLTSATVRAITPPTLGTNAFDSNASGRKIYVPSASVDTYKTATNWSTYASDIEPIS